LRDDFASEERLAKSGEHMLTTEEGTAMAMRMGVEYYLECSALTAQGQVLSFLPLCRVVLPDM